MSYHTPEGFDQRCAMLDETAQHQIRIALAGSRLIVSCTCRPVTNEPGRIRRNQNGRAYEPIATITNADQAWEHWYAYHDAKGVAVT